MSKKNYKVSIHGCDDSTIFEIEMTKAEYVFLKKIADRSQEVSTYGCMPIIYIEGINELERNKK